MAEARSVVDERSRLLLGIGSGLTDCKCLVLKERIALRALYLQNKVTTCWKVTDRGEPETRCDLKLSSGLHMHVVVCYPLPSGIQNKLKTLKKKIRPHYVAPAGLELAM